MKCMVSITQVCHVILVAQSFNGILSKLFTGSNSDHILSVSFCPEKLQYLRLLLMTICLKGNKVT